MAAEGPPTETMPADDESATPSEGKHPFAGWIVSAVFLLGTLYMMFAEPWPTYAAEWFYAIIFGLATVIAAGYALHERGILKL